MAFKKFFYILFALAFFLSGCTLFQGENVDNSPAPLPNIEFTKMRGIWVSYYDYNFSGLSKAEVEEKVEGMINNISSAGFNNIFLHTRANADSIYPSKLFPFSEKLSGTQGADPGYDLYRCRPQEKYSPARLDKPLPHFIGQRRR